MSWEREPPSFGRSVGTGSASAAPPRKNPALWIGLLLLDREHGRSPQSEDLDSFVE